jgi:signal transduction histidine kinase
MNHKLSSLAFVPIAAATVAITIFVVDTLTRPAVAVLYVVVVLFAVRFFERRGVLLVSLGCIVLTMLSVVLSGDVSAENVLINCVISILAIAIAAFLSLENRSTEMALHEAQLQLAHVNRITTLGELTASIAHEVNQPITAVVTHADAALRWLAAQPPDLNEGREALRHIVNDAHRASEVISRIRALAKKESSRKTLLDINETIVEVVSLTRGQVLKNGVSLLTQLSSDLPPILGDRVQLQQVLMNLIINAIEAMGEVSEDRRKLVVCSSKDDSHGVLITVKDSGPGIGKESFDRLFNPFYTTKSTGMGMGLSICRSIIETHGGRVWATSNLPQGAIFHFTLPLH